MKGKLRNYEIQHKLGEGSYGVIYKAVNKNDKSVCVLKQIRLARLNQKAKRNAVNEATILGKLSHPFIVQYIDSFIEDSCLNIIMEYCDGGDLHKFLKLQSKKPLKQDRIWKLFLQICIGLQHIHQRKVLHRDIKTLNIFLHQEQVKIGDLGVAKMLQQKDFAQTMVGTPFYLSPQLCEEKPYNQKSDVWALGCLLYQLCTFKHPFEAANQGSLILKIIRGKYNPIPELYSKELRDLIDSCLQRDYKRRPTAQMILSKPKIKQYLQLYKLHEIKPIERPIIVPKVQQKSKPKSQQKKQQVIARNQNPLKNIIEKPGIYQRPKQNKNGANQIAQTPRVQLRKQQLKRPEIPLPKRAEVPIPKKVETPFVKKPDSARRQRPQVVVSKGIDIKQQPVVISCKQLPPQAFKKQPIIKQVKQCLLSEKQLPPPIVKKEKKSQSKYKFLDNINKHLNSEENLVPSNDKRPSIFYEVPLKNIKSQEQKAQIAQLPKHPLKSEVAYPPLPPKQMVKKVKMDKPVQPRVYESNKNISKSRGIIKSGGFALQEEDKPKSKQRVQKVVDAKPIFGRKPSFVDGQKQKPQKEGIKQIKQKGAEQFQSERNLKPNSISVSTPLNMRHKMPDDRYLVKKSIANTPLPPRVRKGSYNQLARNAQHASERVHNVTKQQRQEVLNLPDVVSNSRDDISSDQQTPKSKNVRRNYQSEEGKVTRNPKFHFHLQDIDDKLILQKYEEMVKSKRTQTNDGQQQQQQEFPEQVEETHSPKANEENYKEQQFEQEIIEQRSSNQSQSEEENNLKEDQIIEYEGQQFHKQPAEDQYSDSFADQESLYEVNRFNLSNADATNYNGEQQQQEIRDQVHHINRRNQSQLEWDFDEEPELPMLQETQTPVFEEANPYLIEEKAEEQTLQDKKNYLQIKLQQNLKREDEINRLMQIKINQCKLVVPSSFQEILQFFRQKLNMDQQYTEEDQRQIEVFLKRRGLTDNRKFQNIYKIMHFEMELENTRKIIQRICKKLSQFDS